MDFVILLLVLLVVDGVIVWWRMKRDRPATKTYLRDGPPLEGGSVAAHHQHVRETVASWKAQQEAIWDLVGQQTATVDELSDWRAV